MKAGTLAVVVCLFAGVSAGAAPGTNEPPATAHVWAEAATAEVSYGGEYSITVFVDTAEEPLGAYDLSLSFDPSVLRWTGVEGGECPEFRAAPIAIERASGEVRICAMQSRRFDGPTGQSEVAVVKFRVVGAMGCTSPISVLPISVVQTVPAGGRRLPFVAGMSGGGHSPSAAGSPGKAPAEQVSPVSTAPTVSLLHGPVARVALPGWAFSPETPEEAFRLVGSMGDGETEKDALRWRSGGEETGVLLIPPAPVSAESVGTVEVRMAVSDGLVGSLLFRRNEKESWIDAERLPFRLRPWKGRLTYRIGCRENRRWEGEIHSFLLVPSDTRGAWVNLESVRFLREVFPEEEASP